MRPENVTRPDNQRAFLYRTSERKCIGASLIRMISPAFKMPNIGVSKNGRPKLVQILLSGKWVKILTQKLEILFKNWSKLVQAPKAKNFKVDGGVLRDHGQRAATWSCWEPMWGHKQWICVTPWFPTCFFLRSMELLKFFFFSFFRIPTKKVENQRSRFF